MVQVCLFAFDQKTLEPECTGPRRASWDVLLHSRERAIAVAGSSMEGSSEATNKMAAKGSFDGPLGSPYSIAQLVKQ
ncbi:hypothetical protein F2Q70_00018276 [Brassica cretica]|uniref:Uncharacterized protein n=1 Tax=Brassica cretica TaxID=69181 RepID=A0A8S9I2X5_BRACR|nr:hypothetical protein F2Q70_00018276 [Brassica cretica]